MDLTNQPIDLEQLIKQLSVINNTQTENNKSFRSTVGIKLETEEVQNLMELVFVTVKDKKYLISIEQSEYVKEAGEGNQN